MYLTRAQVRDFDRRAIEEFGVPGVVLMENAGRGAAEHLLKLNAERRPVTILCGKGNNGGDGYVIARHLDAAGVPVRIVAFETANLRGEAEMNYDICRRAGIEFLADLPTTWDGWIVDALFGTGLTGPVRSPFAAVIDAVNQSGARVFAVDIPSGLDCDTGEPLGPTVRADVTATFVALKAGFANPAARAWTGEVSVVGIGAPGILSRLRLSD